MARTTWGIAAAALMLSCSLFHAKSSPGEEAEAAPPSTSVTRASPAPGGATGSGVRVERGGALRRGAPGARKTGPATAESRSTGSTGSGGAPGDGAAGLCPCPGDGGVGGGGWFGGGGGARDAGAGARAAGTAGGTGAGANTAGGGGGSTAGPGSAGGSAGGAVEGKRDDGAAAHGGGAVRVGTQGDLWPGTIPGGR